jgi:sialic acid synthase SpsE
MNNTKIKDINIIAEIGWNHMGDMKLAKQMIESAAKNGADICKFQTWSESNLKPGAWDSDGRREVYKKAQLNKENHQNLIDICNSNNVEFLTSIFNITDLDFLTKLNSKMIKVPSHEIYNIELIKKCVENFDLTLISTGASYKKEIENISNNIFLEKAIFMHCVSSYPCPANKVNLPRLEYMRNFTKQIGYSGHFHGIDDAIAAICCGATYIEKHFTIDNNLDGRDNKFALLPKDLNKLNLFRKNFCQMNIDLGKDLQECEKDTYQNYRGRWSNE